MLDNNGTLGIGEQEVPVVIPTDEELQQYLYGDEEPIVAAAGQVNPAAVSELIGSSNGNPAGDGDEFDDDDDLLLEGEADERRTQVGFAANPIARLALASGGVLCLVVVVGTIIGGFQSSTQQPPVIQASASPTPAVLPTTMANADGATKEQLAFQQQKELLKGAKAPASKSLPKVAVAKAPPTPTPSPEAIASTPAPVPVAPPPTVPIAPTPVIAPIPVVPIDPNKEWADLAQSGTFGALPTVLVASNNTNSLPPPPIAAPSSLPPVSRPSEISSAMGFPGLSTYASQKKLKIGTLATATLINPIAWLPDGKDPAFANSPKFIVRLDEPLKGIEGETVIPSGAELVVSVRSLDTKTGLADLTALQVIINQQEYSPPPGSITIRGEAGKPLIADKLQDKGRDIATGDLSLILFGSLAKIGGILNQPNSSSSVSSGVATINSVSSSPNIIGAALEGGFSVLAQQQQQRNQQWLQEITTRPDVRFIPAGKRLQVFINQTITL